MIKKIYYWLRDKFSPREERGERSAGHWQALIRATALSLCEKEVKALLEVGCGEGLFLVKAARQFPAATVYGIDISEDRLKRAYGRMSKEGMENVDIIYSHAARMPFEDGKFDAVVCINVLYNLPPGEVVRACLGEIARVCKKGGVVIFDIRNKLNPLLRIKYALAKYYDDTVKNMPLMTYRMEQITELLHQNGMEIVEIIPLGFPANKFSPIIVVKACRK